MEKLLRDLMNTRVRIATTGQTSFIGLVVGEVDWVGDDMVRMLTDKGTTYVSIPHITRLMPEYDE